MAAILSQPQSGAQEIQLWTAHTTNGMLFV